MMTECYSLFFHRILLPGSLSDENAGPVWCGMNATLRISPQTPTFCHSCHGALTVLKEGKIREGKNKKLLFVTSDNCVFGH